MPNAKSQVRKKRVSRGEGWVIVDRRNKYFVGWRAGCSSTPSGSEEFYSVPEWSDDYRSAHVYSSKRAAERAMWSRPEIGQMICRSLGQAAAVGGKYR